MSDAPVQIALLEDRGVVSVTGADGEKLLAGLITNDMSRLAEAPALFAALLTPQGKILFDFFLVRAGEGFLLETARERAGDLVKRLSMYKLRADVQIREVSADFAVAAVWGGDGRPPSNIVVEGAHIFADPRLPALGLRAITETGKAEDLLAASGAQRASAEAYHAYRVGLGVPEAGRDFALGDTFPHEALMDQLNGVSFTKGCFVGQEVVSRMQHRTTVRKRVVPVAGEHELPAGPMPVLAGAAEIGRLGSVAGSRGLALLRLDRVAEARRDGIALTAGGVTVHAEAPAFASFRIEASHESA